GGGFDGIRCGGSAVEPGAPVSGNGGNLPATPPCGVGITAGGVDGLDFTTGPAVEGAGMLGPVGFFGPNTRENRPVFLPVSAGISAAGAAAAGAAAAGILSLSLSLSPKMRPKIRRF